MGLFNATFGQTGTAATFFGGQWWLVGLFLLILFLSFLLAYRVKAEVISTFLVIGFTSIGGYQLFIIDEQIVQTVLFIIFMFVGFVAYLFFGR